MQKTLGYAQWYATLHSATAGNSKWHWLWSSGLSGSSSSSKSAAREALSRETVGGPGVFLDKTRGSQEVGWWWIWPSDDAGSYPLFLKPPCLFSPWTYTTKTHDTYPRRLTGNPAVYQEVRAKCFNFALTSSHPPPIECRLYFGALLH